VAVTPVAGRSTRGLTSKALASAVDSYGHGYARSDRSCVRMDLAPCDERSAVPPFGRPRAARPPVRGWKTRVRARLTLHRPTRTASPLRRRACGPPGVV